MVTVALDIGAHLSAIAYIAGPRVGAAFYNFFHHKGIAIIGFLVGMHFSFFAGSDFIGELSGILKLVGVIMFTHSSLDRVFGFRAQVSRFVPKHTPGENRKDQVVS